jgi:2-polyprenyl-3-methyl-5-hydroxy-6-metoxy-1,4-benzoquinol methylase
MTPVTPTTGRLKVFVVVASYGEKNLGYLKQVIETYRDMTMDVDVVVTSEASKSVDLGVEVVVGTPTRNPRSLPFAHKRLFAERVDRYDLFVYSEDDIHVTEEGIRAFARISKVLEPNEIAGYIRYEVGPDGTRFLPDVHGRFHWRPESVRRRSDYLIGEFTNEHAGFYVLTNEQLRAAIGSGAFLSTAYEGRYEMLESAATDVYVNCGFRKVIGISELDAFLVHHMPNRYVGRMGVPLSLFQEQIETLKRIERRCHPASTLCEVEPKVFESRWGKRYDECPSEELLSTVPAEAKTVLSVGCGSAVTEIELQNRGLAVTAFPLDSVVGATAARRGIEVVYGTLEECFQHVSGRQFDCVIVTNLIHLLPKPWAMVSRCAELVGPKGTLVIEGQNFERLPILIKRAIGVGHHRKVRSFSVSGVQTYGIGAVKRKIRCAGFQAISVRWQARALPPSSGRFPRWSARFGAETWIVRAQGRHVESDPEQACSTAAAQ